ncbi:OmpH family outer membrane protein [Sodaliphilus sp.]|mgnify:CR=1 FL=1|uniref:OmpH family outer membrane protein n=1 Tax=Sodaliphilus sp. TaxID=2815818 RepID=UPI00389023C2
MKFYKITLSIAIVAAMLFGATACNEKQDNSAAKSTAAAGGMNIRYVDEDSIMANYNLAKDFNEAMLRRQNQLDAAQQQRGNEINKFGTAMEQKYKNNGYLTEESLRADQAKLQKMQSDAQSYLGNLQQSIATELEQSRTQVLDSINNFMKEYAKQKGYDMVIYKSAALYVDEKFDVTKDVVEGLNKRYVKVGKEEEKK